MALFVVKHQHSAQSCPARDPRMGPMLLQHLSKGNASKFGITIQSEAVVDGQHSLYLTLEASDSQKVQEFMAPFDQAGSVEVLPASRCEAVVQRARC